MSKSLALVLLTLTASTLYAQTLVINEFMADNETTIADPTDGAFDDWIEIYNPGATEVNLSNFYLTDEAGVPMQWPFPDTTIAPAGFLLVWADGDTGAGLHTNFRLSRSGEFIGLYFDGGTDAVVVDTLTFGPQSPDISYGRNPDGSDTFSFFSPATPGASNSGELQIPQLFINELMADNSKTIIDPTDGAFDDWLEIYNAEQEDVELTNFFLTDDPAQPAKWPFPAGVIAPGSHLLVWADNDSSNTSGLHTNFALSRQGEFLGLYFNTGTDIIAIDTLSFGEQRTDVSYGRLPDGSGNFALFSPATPGTANANELAIPPVLINEVMADNTFIIRDPTDDVFDDWVEIYNAGDSALNLDGFFLTDDDDDRGRWPFPDTTLNPGAFALIWADNDSGEAGLHTNFGLSKSGDFIGLYWYTGADTVLVDAREFGPQRSDISLGRNPDGGETFVFYIVPTPGVSNAAGTVLIERNLFINELMADNLSFLQDPTDGNFDDWLELYNGGVSEVNLSGYYLTDDSGQTRQWPLPDTTLAAGDFLLVWTDGDAGAPGLHANFRLSRSGEFVGLYFDAGAEILAIDTLRFGEQTTDVSYGRNPDGSEELVFYAQGTPGSSNADGVIVSVDVQVGQLVRDFGLQQNYPNPFNPETTISYAIAANGSVKLTIYNLLGQEIVTLVDKKQQRGQYSVSWDGRDAAGKQVASGVYVYRIEVHDFVETRKMLLLR